MKAVLAYRNYGVHRTVKECALPTRPFVRWVDVPARGRSPVVFEEALLSSLPKGFLPEPPSRILLMAGDKGGGTAVSKPKLFRPWGKYFACYSLTVERGKTEEEQVLKKLRKGFKWKPRGLNRIDVYLDRSCDMAVAKLNGRTVFSGNFWDFHPGCFAGAPQELGKIRNYKRPLGFALALKQAVEKDGGRAEIRRGTYRCDPATCRGSGYRLKG